MPLKSTDVVLVIGGAGFLGQHIIKHLLNETPVKELRVFDTKSLVDNQIAMDDFPASIRSVKCIIGDVRKTSELVSAMFGCTAVIHCAAVVDFRLFPDLNTMNDVNVKGTSNVIEACIQCNVSSLVFTSTVDVAVGNKDIVNGDEAMRLPERLLIHGYGHSKQQAEVLIMAANGRPLAEGTSKVFRTLCLRPTVMYGEGDPYLLPTVIATASKTGSLLPVGSGKALSQHSYVGNVAWAHVCALQTLVDVDPDNKDISGRAYFITDDTPVMNAFKFFELFLRKCNFSLSKFRIPYSLVYGLLFVFQCIVSVLRLVFPVNSSTTLGSIMYINHTVYFNRALAERLLNYVPKYDFATSFDRSICYYVKTFVKV